MITTKCISQKIKQNLALLPGFFQGKCYVRTRYGSVGTRFHLILGTRFSLILGTG